MMRDEDTDKLDWASTVGAAADKAMGDSPAAEAGPLPEPGIYRADGDDWTYFVTESGRVMASQPGGAPMEAEGSALESIRAQLADGTLKPVEAQPMTELPQPGAADTELEAPKAMADVPAPPADAGPLADGGIDSAEARELMDKGKGDAVEVSLKAEDGDGEPGLADKVTGGISKGLGGFKDTLMNIAGKAFPDKPDAEKAEPLEDEEMLNAEKKRKDKE